MTISPLMPVYPRCGVRPVKGENCHLIDEDGTRYLDFASGIAVNLLGHSHDGLISAIQEQAAFGNQIGNGFRRSSGGIKQDENAAIALFARQFVAVGISKDGECLGVDVEFHRGADGIHEWHQLLKVRSGKMSVQVCLGFPL